MKQAAPRREKSAKAARDPAPPAGGRRDLFCRNCGEPASDLDTYCPTCGTLSEEE